MKEDILEVLLDENNKSQLLLSDSNGVEHWFEQIAVIPYNERIYCILKPTDKILGISDNEALVFYYDEDRDDLFIELNEVTAIKVFNEYYKLLSGSIEE